MVLSVYDFLYGIAQLAAGFLAVIAGIIALTMFRISHERSELRAWKYLLSALIVFVVVEVIGGLGAFGVHIAQFWTHVLVSLILFLVIIALLVQIHVNRGWLE